MEKRIKYDGVEWRHFDLETGKEIKKGTAYFDKSNRLVGPGVNNVLIARLKKGESVSFKIESLNLFCEFIPKASAW